MRHAYSFIIQHSAIMFVCLYQTDKHDISILAQSDGAVEYTDPRKWVS